MKTYYLKLADGSWVSSPTNTTTTILGLRASFGTKWGNASEQDRESTKAAMERIHGPLTIVDKEDEHTT